MPSGNSGMVRSGVRARPGSTNPDLNEHDTTKRTAAARALIQSLGGQKFWIRRYYETLGSGLVLGMVFLLALGAESQQAPKPHQMRGCLKAGSTPGTYLLTDLATGLKTLELFRRR